MKRYADLYYQGSVLWFDTRLWITWTRFIYLHMHLRHAVVGDGQPQDLLIDRIFKVARFLQCYGTTLYIQDAALLSGSMMLMI